MDAPRLWSRYDWVGPVVATAHTAYLIANDGVRVVLLMGSARVIEFALDFIEGPNAALHIAGHAVHASTIVRNGDYGLLVGFVLIQAYKLLKRMWKDDH